MAYGTPIDMQRVKEVCKIGKGSGCCAFLVMDGGVFECGKGGGAEPCIRRRLAEGSINAKGDNCSGPPDFAPVY